MTEKEDIIQEEATDKKMEELQEWIKMNEDDLKDEFIKEYDGEWFEFCLNAMVESE